MQVTVFKHYSEVDKPSYVSLESVLGAIKDGRKKDEILRIRKSTDESEIRALKMQLPCVIYSGRFDIEMSHRRKDGSYYKSFRNDESLSVHSKLVAFDIDDVEDVEKLKADLIQDDYIYAVWKSPSGTGVHGLIKIADGNRHEEHYSALLKRYPMFDTTARNPSRVLFLSYDENLLINEDSKTFFDLVEREEFKGIELSGSFTDYRKLDIAAKMIRMAETGARHNAVIKSAYLVGGYVAGGIVEESIATEVLKHEVFKKFDRDELDIEYKAIEDGIKAGQFMPINEIAKYQQSAMEEIGIVEDELSFLSDNKTDEEFIRKYRSGLIPMGLPFGYDYMDSRLLLKEGEFYALLGHSHVGKSSVGFWLSFISALKYDWGWVIYTGENRVATVKMKLIEFYCGMKIKEIKEHHFRQAMVWVNERFFFVNNDNMYKYEELLSYTQSVSKYHSIKGLLIDPVNALRSDNGNKYGHEMEMYTNMLLFTKRTNISLVLSIHSRTQSQRERGKDGNQVMPFAADADGGALLYNKADVFITTNRNIQDPETWMITELHISKQRNKETGGDVTPKDRPIKLKMSYGVEFTDEFDKLPFDRDFLKEELVIDYKPATSDDVDDLPPF